MPHPSTVDPKLCYVDGVKNVSEQHHIIPVEYNGPRSGTTVPLCPLCHTNIHREAENWHNTGKFGKYVNDDNYPDLNALARATVLATYVRDAKLRFNAEGGIKGDDTRNMMQVSFTPEELAIAHDLKRALGFKSLPRMVKYLILDKHQKLSK